MNLGGLIVDVVEAVVEAGKFVERAVWEMMDEGESYVGESFGPSKDWSEAASRFVVDGRAGSSLRRLSGSGVKLEALFCTGDAAVIESLTLALLDCLEGDVAGILRLLLGLGSGLAGRSDTWLI